MTVHNLMEDIAKSCLKDMLQNHEEIDEKSQSDILAIALNKLPAKYVSTTLGEVFAKTLSRMQVDSDVIRELSLAMEFVLKSDRKSVLDQDNK